MAWAAVGAVVGLALVVLPRLGEYEGGDAVVVLGPVAAVVGAGVGLLVRWVVRRGRG